MTLILEPEGGLEAPGGVNRPAQLNDGSEVIEPQLISYLDPLGDDAYDMPCLHVAGQTLLGEVLTGLGGDERMAEVPRRNIQDSVVLPGMSEEEALQARATWVVAVRLLRTIAWMKAVELRNIVAQQRLASWIPSTVCVALILTVDIFDVVRLDACPDDIVRVVLDYAGQMLWLTSDDLNAYFAELGTIVQQREKNPGFGRFGELGVA